MTTSEKLSTLKRDYQMLHNELDLYFPKALGEICLTFHSLPSEIKRYELWMDFINVDEKMAIEDEEDTTWRSHNYDKEQYEKGYEEQFIKQVASLYGTNIPRDVLEITTKMNVRQAFHNCRSKLSKPLDIMFIAGGDFDISGCSLQFYNKPQQLPPNMDYMVDLLQDLTRYENLNKLSPFPFPIKWYVAWKKEWSSDRDSLLFIGPIIPSGDELADYVDDENATTGYLNSDEWSYNGVLPPPFICLGTFVDFFKTWLFDYNQSIFGGKLM